MNLIDKYLGERKFDLGSGSMGNGVTIWNRAREVHGDYEKIAHIDRNRKITYYIKNPPKEVVQYAEKIAKGNNFAMSQTQPHMKVFNEASPDAHQKKIAIDTVKNPMKGKFLGGPSAEEAEEILRKKFGYTDAQIKKLKKG